jgi:cobalamin-dependent methionine synthase I
MIEIVDIPTREVIPSLEDVLSEQGIDSISQASERTRKMAEKSISEYRRKAKPIGIIRNISNSEFKSVYQGEGNNESNTPLDLIFPKASALTLFAVTLGNDISARIVNYFDRDEFAAGSILDSAASVGTELSADYIESLIEDKLNYKGKYSEQTGTMRFSPGYCGWHMSGQKKLFESLQPDKIGIELTSSYLMVPLKSISGVVVVGSNEIFEFEDDFPFCSECRDHSCVERIKSLKEK